MPETTRQELLRRAVDVAGLREVARALTVSPERVEAWMNGQAPMPDGRLLMLASFLERFGRPEKG